MRGAALAVLALPLVTIVRTPAGRELTRPGVPGARAVVRGAPHRAGPPEQRRPSPPAPAAGRAPSGPSASGSRSQPTPPAGQRDAPLIRLLDRSMGALLARQVADGGWPAELRRGVELDRVGATALSLLALLATGQTQHYGPHSAQIRRALDFLLARQAADGQFVAEAASSGMAGLAIGECWGMTRDKRCRAALERFLSRLRKEQAAGGWARDTEAGPLEDLRAVGWQLLALKSASLSGLQVQREMFLQPLRWLAHRTDPRTGEVASQDPRLGAAIGVVIRTYAGQPAGDPVTRRAIEYLVRSAGKPSPDAERHFYWGNLATAQAGGDFFRSRWVSVVRQNLRQSTARTAESDTAALAYRILQLRILGIIPAR